MPNRRQVTWFCAKAPLAVFAALVPLPLLVIFAFLLLSILLNLVGLPGVKLVADELLTALAFVVFVQGSVLFAVSFFATLYFIGSLWRWRAGIWYLAAGLFSKSPDLVRVLRSIWIQAPNAQRPSATYTAERISFPAFRRITGAFAHGLTPQLE